MRVVYCGSMTHIIISHLVSLPDKQSFQKNMTQCPGITNKQCPGLTPQCPGITKL